MNVASSCTISELIKVEKNTMTLKSKYRYRYNKVIPWPWNLSIGIGIIRLCTGIVGLNILLNTVRVILTRWNEHVKELIAIKKINAVKNFNAKNYGNQQCQLWTHTFQNQTFLDVKRKNKSKDSVIVNCQ